MLKTVVALLKTPSVVCTAAVTVICTWLAPIPVMLVASVTLTSLILQLDWHVAIMELLQPRVRWRCRSPAAVRNRMVGLTIDDVPLLNSPSHLEEILDILREHSVHATLFVMSGFSEAMDEGLRARGEALLRRAVTEGHELGNHHMYDEPAFSLTEEELTTKFMHCDTLLRRLQPRAPRWHRPGSGLWTRHMLSMAENMGYDATVLANCFPHDTAPQLTFIHHRLLAARARPGCIALVHDRSYTPDTLRAALPRIRSKGLRCVTLSTLFDATEQLTEEDGQLW